MGFPVARVLNKYISSRESSFFARAPTSPKQKGNLNRRESLIVLSPNGDFAISLRRTVLLKENTYYGDFRDLRRIWRISTNRRNNQTAATVTRQSAMALALLKQAKQRPYYTLQEQHRSCTLLVKYPLLGMLIRTSHEMMARGLELAGFDQSRQRVGSGTFTSGGHATTHAREHAARAALAFAR